jgi:hypothetical protein
MMSGKSPSKCSGNVTDCAVCERPPPPRDPAAMPLIATLSKAARSELIDLMMRYL